MRYEPELAVALNAVEKACRLCQAVRLTLQPGDSVQKQDRSPVTVADLGSQIAMAAELRLAFPADVAIGEENADPLSGNDILAGRLLDLLCAFNIDLDRAAIASMLSATGAAEIRSRGWVMDPLDGTKGFLRGGQYAVALALIEEGTVRLGVLGCPAYPFPGEEDPGCILYGIAGEGAFVRPLGRDKTRRLEVTDPAPVVHRICEPWEPEHAAHDLHAAIAVLLGITAAPLRMDSQCKYAAVALGDASIYLRMPRDGTYREKTWDHAAGSLIVQETGGTVTSALGEPLDFSLGRLLPATGGIVVSRGGVHEKVLRAVRSVVEVMR